MGTLVTRTASTAKGLSGLDTVRSCLLEAEGYENLTCSEPIGRYERQAYLRDLQRFPRTLAKLPCSQIGVA